MSRKFLIELVRTISFCACFVFLVCVFSMEVRANDGLTPDDDLDLRLLSPGFGASDENTFLLSLPEDKGEADGNYENDSSYEEDNGFDFSDTGFSASDSGAVADTMQVGMLDQSEWNQLFPILQSETPPPNALVMIPLENTALPMPPQLPYLGQITTPTVSHNVDLQTASPDNQMPPPASVPPTSVVEAPSRTKNAPLSRPKKRKRNGQRRRYSQSTYICDLCEEENPEVEPTPYFGISAFRAHFKVNHPGMAVYKCPDCHERVERQVDLKGHENYHSEERARLSIPASSPRIQSQAPTCASSSDLTSGSDLPVNLQTLPVVPVHFLDLSFLAHTGAN